MKYKIITSESNEIIKNYKIEEDKIIITFFDSTNYEIPLSEKNEEKLLEKMVEQAVYRKSKISQKNINAILLSKLIFDLSRMISTLSTVVGSIVSFVSTPVGIVLVILSSPVAILSDKKYRLISDQMNELDKYSIYLSSIHGKILNQEDANLFNGVNNKEKELNINTLDNYSLEDIKKIRDNLKRIDEYKDYFEDSNNNNPILIKKV